MSSQKISTIWHRLKNLFISNKQAETHNHETVKSSNTTCNASNQTAHQASSSQNSLFAESAAQKPNTAQNNESTQSESQQKRQRTPVFGHKTASSSQTQTSDKSLKFTKVTNIKQTEGMKQRSKVSPHSKHPITDAVLEFLDANEMTYHYHDALQSQDDQSISPKASPAKNNSRANHDPNETYASHVHHISMAMRYFIDTDLKTHQAASERRLDAIRKDIEWGCVIRIHEHTQLLAIYGILPFKLPTTHLDAGITLATQLNYDMMLGNVEIDIRDGEIRFKNALDLEPIINASGGIAPPPIINFLLKSVMAMTTSFEPIFRELINSDAENFELQSLLAQIDEAQLKQTFFLASDTLQ